MTKILGPDGLSFAARPLWSGLMPFNVGTLGCGLKRRHTPWCSDSSWTALLLIVLMSTGAPAQPSGAGNRLALWGLVAGIAGITGLIAPPAILCAWFDTPFRGRVPTAVAQHTAARQSV